MTRESEIEALAMVYCEGYAAAAMPASVLDQFFAEGVARAEAIIAARDRYRVARQPAPETPTPRIEVLAEEVASALFTDYNGFLVDRLVLTYDGPHREMGGLCYNAVRDTVAQILRQHAATLKEKP